MNSPSRSQFQSGDSRLSATKEEIFEFYKFLEEEQKLFCEDGLFGERKDHDILLEANSTATTKATEDLQNEVKIEDESEDDGFRGGDMLNAADLLDSDENEELPDNHVRRLLFPCPVKNCPYSSRSFKQLEEHVRIHSDTQIFFCDVCKTEFSSKEAAMEHIQERQERKCCGCGKQFPLTSNFTRHLRRHSGEKPYSCTICGRRFALSTTLNSHVLTHSRAGPYSSKPPLFVCFLKECSYSYKTLKELEEHMETHADEQDFVCDLCKKTISSKEDAIAHSLQKEKNECCACGKKFSTSHNLIAHFRCHTGEKPFVCTICDQRFRTSSTLNRHVMAHTGEKPFSCDICEKRFATKALLKIHERTHSGEKPIKCSQCDYKCISPNYLREHSRKHTGYKPYSCGHCGKRFTNRNGLNYHESTHTGEKPFKCDQCGHGFQKRHLLDGHIRTHTGEKPFSCEKCDKKFTQSGHLKKHMKKKHLSYRDSMDFPSPDQFDCNDTRLSDAQEEAFDCHKPEEEKESLFQEILFQDVKSRDVLLNSAEATAESAVDLQNKITIESVVDGFYSPTFDAADLLFDSAAQKFLEEKRNSFYEDYVSEDVEEFDILLNANSAEVTAEIAADFQIEVKTEKESGFDGFHAPRLNAADLLAESDDGQEKNDDEDLEDEERRSETVPRLLFVCPIKNCPSSYKNFNELEEHMEVHSGDQDFFCDVCKKDFSSKDEAMAHIQEREMKECCGCGRTFSCPSQLIQHLRYHSGEKPFVCKTCGQRCAQRHHLNVHMLTHTGEKPFSCRFCEKSFAVKTCLKKHERTHTGEKPYKCEHCDYSCTTSGGLSRHNRIHTGKKPFVCGLCEKRFSLKFDLERHEFVHTGNEPFECDQCGKRFNVKSNLAKHIRIHTGKKPCKECDKKFAQSASLKNHMKRES